MFYTLTTAAPSAVQSSPAVETPLILEYETHALPNSRVHTLRIPAQSQFEVAVAVSPALADIEAFAQETGAIAVLNAGFFDPNNQQTTSYVTQGGRLVADPRQNQRLVGNPDLQAYLDQILNRTEFRRYRCLGAIRYAIAQYDEPIPTGCELEDAVGAGPRLLPANTAVAEGFLDAAQGRDALGSTQPNARTAVGLTASGDVMWVMVEQIDQAAPSGMTLAELADFMHQLGMVEAMNLDGGSSSGLYYRGEAIYGRRDRDGHPITRPVKSVLWVKSRSDS